LAYLGVLFFANEGQKMKVLHPGQKLYILQQSKYLMKPSALSHTGDASASATVAPPCYGKLSILVGACEPFLLWIVMCWLWPGGLSQPKPAVKSQAKPGFWHSFPKPVALALILESHELWL
jgi:hypothetical protein